MSHRALVGRTGSNEERVTATRITKVYNGSRADVK